LFVAQSIKLLTDEDPVRWPRLCARCGAGEPLRSVEALIAAPKSARPKPDGPVPTGNDLLSIDYPVCRRHARYLALAQWLTRSTLVPRIVRGLMCTLGGTSVLALALNLVLLVLAAFGAVRGSETSAPLLAIEIAFVLPLALLIWAYRATPVRLTGMEIGAVTIRFGFDPYAQAFAQANTKILVRKRRPDTTR
jgi:hypothetical protein